MTATPPTTYTRDVIEPGTDIVTADASQIVTADGSLIILTPTPFIRDLTLATTYTPD